MKYVQYNELDGKIQAVVLSSLGPPTDRYQLAFPDNTETDGMQINLQTLQLEVETVVIQT